MKPITTITNTTIPIMKENIDTDQLIPKQFLKNILKTGYGKDLFYDWRYLPGGKANPDFELNKPERKGASILITGDNFGCGSSREHAVWALKDFGIEVVVAGSYSDIFYMNSTKNGLLAIVLPENERKILAEIPANEKVTVNLPDQVVQCRDKSFHFEIDPLWKHKFVNGLDDIAITFGYEKQIKDYEEHMPSFN
ncbi:3-isopropylmalate dehydratase small subunit [Companilactobacillus mishanensis]|uniref:3-isopropylmalate dehydratase small subunit n=1 Tax=Companilactobacillus mishanensis TaxID=2486008 RepID=A0A5P0ZI72_9LACO|nr:3-isopropylmalate dehydratase small subunit [Companilactobacillus mishanensis]MQS52759.1 3-isopropylmalate dehydratase small subunit [Companilactobacillus mishanensis]